MIKISSFVFTPRLIPTLITMLGVGVLVALGVWQLERNVWKQAIMTNYKTHAGLPALTDLPPPTQQADAMYRHVVLGGKYLHHLSINLRPRVMNGQMGYDLVTPMRLYTSETILVLRGFVPNETKDALDQPIGTVAVTGMLRPFSARFWRPDNQPNKDQWYWIDPDAIANKHNLENPYPLFVVAEDTPLNTPWPKPEPYAPYFHDFHIAYAATWFLLAVIFFGIYVKTHARKQ